MATSSPQVAPSAIKQVDTEVLDVDKEAAEKEKERNFEIVRRATTAFLEYRRALNSIMSPSIGVIDDLTVTWIARYGKEKKDGPLKKFGRMHVSLHTKTAPEPTTGHQTFNSFTIDSNVSFERDLHPAVEEEEKKKVVPESGKVLEEKIEEIVSAAAQASS
jgi:hypothetical protein